MTTTEEKLDLLAEFKSQKDGIEFQKKSLLEEVKVPQEVLQVMNDGNKRTQEFESEGHHALTLISAEAEEELKKITIPDEIKAALAEIDRQRKLVEEKRNAKADEIRKSMFAKRDEIYAETQAQTTQVYADIAKRKQEIEAEFAGKLEAVDENIAKLESEIKAEAKTAGKTFKGKFFMAVYVKGRITWNTEKMEAWIIDHPFLKDARKEGEPSITLRHV